MSLWAITLHGAAGILSAVEAGESQFVIGTETASDVFTVHGEGVMPRHAWVWISEAGLQVEDLGAGTLVNGYQITERVQVEYPASVQVGEITLVIEVKAVQPAPVSSAPSSMDITIPQRSVTKSNASIEVTIPQRTPTRSNVKKITQTNIPSADSNAADEAANHFRYTLVREIARGGMGQIYFGEDPQLKRNVAVKVSSVSEGGEDPRFSKEAEVLAQLAHPNIVPIYNIGVDGQSRPFYSMKLVKGRTLQAVLNAIRDGDAAAMKEYTRATLLTVFRKVCDAMAFAHAKGVLHRDLKPENIMVGEYGEVLVMDWGLAKVLGEREEVSSAVSRVNDTGDYGMTMEGEVMGTPQYMSPEQAVGMVAELDTRSDIYSLGGILYAILTLRPPIDGTTLDEVLTKVKNGHISSLLTVRGNKSSGSVGTPAKMQAEVPEALQAVTLKAMATDRNKRYGSVEAFAGDIERYQNGFATQAEEAGILRRVRLWVARNRAIATSAAVLVILMGKVVFDGQRAALAIKRLSASAPIFAARAHELLRSGEFAGALEAADNAVDLEPRNASYHVVRGNALQVLMRLEAAQKAFLRAVELGGAEGAIEGQRLTEEVLAAVAKNGEEKAKLVLYEGLSVSGRQYEAMEFGKELGDFWKARKQDLSGVPELVRRLESKLLPVPGTELLMSSTEMTIGEWKLYLKAEGLPNWQHPVKGLEQGDEHPVVNVSWKEVKKMCVWLSKVTGKEWRLPTNAEWDAAVGNNMYPWGDYYPPNWNDGNYSIGKDGKNDRLRAGLDGIIGTAPVGSFKPNALGFYDLGGNVWEWTGDEIDEKTGLPTLRGGGHLAYENFTNVQCRWGVNGEDRLGQIGFRITCRSGP
jgi:serine/threonine protein kinase/formylglycine-generating enzyme required for sulfatase activity